MIYGGEDERDRAVEARIGGNEYRTRQTRIGRGHGYKDWAACDAAVVEAVTQVQRDRKASRRAQLPESAFDWPIYRAAMVALLLTPEEQRAYDIVGGHYFDA